MRFRLRTLLLIAAIMPLLLAGLHGWCKTRLPNPDVIVALRELRSYSGGRYHPNWFLENYRLEESPSGERATLTELPTGIQWMREQSGNWQQLPHESKTSRKAGYVLRGRPRLSGGWLYSAHEVKSSQ